ncbi:MAG: hypothetical protein WA373_00450, partial [Burkholderiales bacterium]
TRLLALPLSVSFVFTQNFAAAQTKPAFTQQELDQMLAPIALYSDSLPNAAAGSSPRQAGAQAESEDGKIDFLSLHRAYALLLERQ